jgi:quercetin dioxygenase-like cupin family protein
MQSPKRSAEVTRREALILGASACATAFVADAQMAVPAEERSATAPLPSVFSKDTDNGNLKQFFEVHDGKGSVGIKLFPFQGNSAPANFIVYDIPPGASEGVHVHHLDDRNHLGPFDEYYYIVSGKGQMKIDGQIVPVAMGDHVHTPLDVSHGIENTHASEHLKVFLTFIRRA